MAGLPVPKTILVKTDVLLASVLDGKKPDGWDGFLAELADAVSSIGLPCFLRTGQTSGKHSWLKTCYLAQLVDLERHVVELVEHSHIVSMLGLPTDVWAVRQLLPTDPIFRVYCGMPVVREFRCFVDGPEVVCVHPYWPREALVQGFQLKPIAEADLITKFKDLSKEYKPPTEDEYNLPEDFDRKYNELLCWLHPIHEEQIRGLASRAGRLLKGKWSIDVLEVDDTWSITDCAVAADSFHWEGCPNIKRFQNE